MAQPCVNRTARNKQWFGAVAYHPAISFTWRRKSLTVVEGFKGTMNTQAFNGCTKRYTAMLDVFLLSASLFLGSAADGDTSVIIGICESDRLRGKTRESGELGELARTRVQQQECLCHRVAQGFSRAL